MKSQESNEPTPNGGVRSVIHYLDEGGQPVDKEEAVKAVIIEYDAKGNQIFRTYGTLNRNKPKPSLLGKSLEANMAEQENQKPTRQSAEGFYRGMQRSAEEWRERLKDPQLQKLIQAGEVRVSPLIEKLLELFPAQASQPQKPK